MPFTYLDETELFWECVYVDTLAVYLVLLGVSAGLAWYIWGFPSVWRLDERVLGERGIAISALRQQFSWLSPPS